MSALDTNNYCYARATGIGASKFWCGTRSSYDELGLAPTLARITRLREVATESISPKAFNNAEIFARRLFAMRPDCPRPAVSGGEDDGYIYFEWRELTISIGESRVFSPAKTDDDVMAAADSLQGLSLTSPLQSGAASQCTQVDGCWFGKSDGKRSSDSKKASKKKASSKKAVKAIEEDYIDDYGVRPGFCENCAEAGIRTVIDPCDDICENCNRD